MFQISIRQLPDEFQEKGSTLTEIAVAIVIIVFFSMVLIADFPGIIRQFAVSRSAYKLSQDIRRTEDLGLSGIQIESQETPPPGGYGLYINTEGGGDKQYIIYADNCSGPPNFEYDSDGCDSIIETIKMFEEKGGVYIKYIKNEVELSFSSVSINFTPPNPKVTITAAGGEINSINIVIGSTFDNNLEKIISVNSSGLIEVK